MPKNNNILNIKSQLDDNKSIINETLTEEDKNHLHFIVNNYLNVDNLIRNKMKEIKDFKEKKKNYENMILNFLEKKNQNIIQISDGKLIKNKCQTKVPIKKNHILQAIKTKINDSSIVNDIMNEIDNLRDLRYNLNLKRTQIRKI
jgi:hypothetical protein